MGWFGRAALHRGSGAVGAGDQRAESGHAPDKDTARFECKHELRDWMRVWGGSGSGVIGTEGSGRRRLGKRRKKNASVRGGTGLKRNCGSEMVTMKKIKNRTRL